jgi:hypothetical protein
MKTDNLGFGFRFSRRIVFSSLLEEYEKRAGSAI